MKISLKAFNGLKRGKSLPDIVDTLKEFGIPDEIIEAAKQKSGVGVSPETE